MEDGVSMEESAEEQGEDVEQDDEEDEEEKASETLLHDRERCCGEIERDRVKGGR